tara:strand:+ start:4225 stop:5409 length:1185 start_codon:yes stop_codon:yes gene_type:complete
MKINVLTPWYPDESLGYTYSGVFIKRQVEALESSGYDVSVQIPKLYKHPARSVPMDIINQLTKLAESNPSGVFRRRNGLSMVPTPIPARASMLQKASSLKEALKLKRIMEPSQADINHVHVALPIAPALLDLSEVPLIITEHSSHVRHECQIPEVADLYRRSITEAKAFICVSRFLQKEISRTLNIDIGSTWKIVPNIVDFSAFHYQHKREYSCKSWVYVGALYESKGVMNLLKTFNHFTANYEADAQLTLIGGGPLEEWIKRYSRRNRIDHLVDIRGPVRREDLAEIFSTKDLMVHLSPYETFGIVSLEAIASGLPVVSIKNGGSEDTWEDLSEISGLILDPSAKYKEIADSIEKWRSGIRNLQLKDASEILRKRFSGDVIVSQLKEIYEEAL